MEEEERNIRQPLIQKKIINLKNQINQIKTVKIQTPKTVTQY